MAHVLIVGAGPAGACLAYLLAQRGISVTLLERQRNFEREFRGEVLMPSGLDALERIGLATPLAAVPSFVPEDVALYLDGKPLLEVRLDAEFFDGRAPRAVSQTHLLEMLVAEAAKSPNFSLRRGATVKSLISEAGRIAGARIRTEAGEENLRADLVIGADGRASAVRKQGGFIEKSVDQPMDIVWFKVPCPDDWRGARAYSGRGHLLIAYRSWDGNLQVAWVILKGTFGELRSRGVEQWVEQMANHVTPDLAAHLRAHTDNLMRPFLLDVVSDRVESWSVPGALLIGDAAHTMSPVGGQGINIALRDSIVAANHLVPVLTPPRLDVSALDAALERIEVERMREVAPIQALQSVPPRIVLSTAWWGNPVRRVLGRLLRRPFVQARLLANLRAFLFGITEVRLDV